MNYLSTDFADKQAEFDFSTYCAQEGRGYQVPVYPERVAEVLWNIPTIFLDKGTLGGEAIAYADFESQHIVVECCDFGPRERFSTAHEVGHFSLHRYLVALSEVYDRYELQREKQADAYASALLMPRPVLLPFLEKKSGMLATPEYLISITKQHFNVSDPVARIRLENIGAIPSPIRTVRDVKKYDNTMESERQNWSLGHW